MRSLLLNTFLLSVGSLAVGSVGCGGKSSANLNLSGKVTVNGAPAQNVMIRLSDSQGGDYSGTTDEEGKFTIAAVTAGEKTVTIFSKHAVDPTMPPPSAAKSGPGGQQYGGGQYGKMAMPPKGPEGDSKAKAMIKEKLKENAADAKLPTPPEGTKIPAKYADKAKSGLTWNVSPDNLTKDFTLND